MDFLLIALLTLINGLFAMSELALASSRKARLAAMEEAGDKGAASALKLLENPTQFLSTVQVGITSIGVLNGIVGEAAFSGGVAVWLMTWGMKEAAAAITATALVVAVITFTTIIFGELVPKRIGQLYPEPVARLVARPMAWLAGIAKPFVSLLSFTTHAVLKLLRIDQWQPRGDRRRNYRQLGRRRRCRVDRSTRTPDGAQCVSPRRSTPDFSDGAKVGHSMV